MSTVQQIIKYAQRALKGTTEQAEIQPLCRIIFQELEDWSFAELLLNYNTSLPEPITTRAIEVIDRLSMGEPIQYIFGHTEFCGIDFRVNKATLIPRPETAEMIELISNSGTYASILDIGTGSGCIAISLAKRFPDAKIQAIDVSNKALEVAQKNAANAEVTVNFAECNILEWDRYNFEHFELIVSNPPYITEAECVDMEKRVLDYEPHTALFVPNTDPLLFYRNIGEMARRYLLNGGSLWFEINEQFGLECKTLLVELGYSDIKIHNDAFNKNRFISATWITV